MKTMRRLTLSLLSLLLGGCLGMPDGVQPVGNFELDRYLGTWYEIARLDHSFERGLERVTADYSLREDGGVRVINRGYAPDSDDWKQAEGKAYFVREADEAYLRVSFFGPFYGSYVVFDLDETYQHAFVTSSNTSYLWLLARSPQVSQDVIDRFVKTTTALGYATDNLIFVNQK